MSLEWKNTRSGEEADLGHGLLLAVWWEGIERVPSGESHYNVTVFGRRLKGRSATLEDGKNRAITAAIQWLGAANKLLADKP